MMNEGMHTPIEAVADAHQHSNLVILRFSSGEAADNFKKPHPRTRNLRMHVTICKMGQGAIVDN
jgi:hypothetical protein